MRAAKSCFLGGRFRADFRGVACAMYLRFGGSHLVNLEHQSSPKWRSQKSCISGPSAPPRKHKNNDLRLSGGEAFGSSRAMLFGTPFYGAFGTSFLQHILVSWGRPLDKIRWKIGAPKKKIRLPHSVP